MADLLISNHPERDEDLLICVVWNECRSAHFPSLTPMKFSGKCDG
jgi:hypothetical protein